MDGQDLGDGVGVLGALVVAVAQDPGEPERDAQVGGRDVQVIIGRENITPSMRDCALITAPYRLGSGHAVGAIGVVGPMRIEYARMMAGVNYVARHIERIFWEEKAAD